MSKQSESKKYQAMLEEVEAIVQQVSSPDVDLDVMVEKIERGYGLIQKMRERLEQTKMKIEKLRADYESSAAGAPAENRSDGE